MSPSGCWIHLQTLSRHLTSHGWSSQCEKHSKKEEALAKLREGAKFDDVAREFSEDKARQGTAPHRRVCGNGKAADFVQID